MNNTACKKEHRYSPIFSALPIAQSGVGRHKCAGCAYEKGFQDGKLKKESINMDLDNLPYSQAGEVRHRSPHAAYAQGYLDGVQKSCEQPDKL